VGGKQPAKIRGEERTHLRKKGSRRKKQKKGFRGDLRPTVIRVLGGVIRARKKDIRD